MTRKTHGGYAPEVVSFYKPDYSAGGDSFVVKWNCPENTAKDQHVAVELSFAGGPVIAYAMPRCSVGEQSFPVDIKEHKGRLHAKVELDCVRATTLLLATVRIPSRLKAEGKVNTFLKSGSGISLALMYNEKNRAGWTLTIGGDDQSPVGETISTIDLWPQSPHGCEPVRVEVARKQSQENAWTADLLF